MIESKEGKQTTENPAPVASTLDEIQALCARPLKVRFSYGGRVCELETRHLTPKESELLKLQMDEVMPPILKGKTEADDRYDYTNVEYLKRKTRSERECRAQAIFWTTKAFHGKQPELVKEMYLPSAKARLVEFVNSTLTDDVLEALYAVILSVEIGLAEQVNFTSPAG